MKYVSKLNFSELMKKESIFLTENNPSKTPERREKMKNQILCEYQ